MKSSLGKNFFMASLALGLFSLLSACQSVYTPGGEPQVIDQSPNVSEGSTAQPVLNHPRQVALLLPLSGKHAPAAKALQEGFLASYYASNGAKPTVRVYDTTRGKDIQQVYDIAVQEGADFVVGPLDKEEVRRLSYAPLKTPVLALNHHPGVRTSNHFIQFSLSPEDEAEQIAEKAKQKGYTNAGVIVPDNAWGRRIAQAFQRRWQGLGGRVLQTVYANPTQDQSAAVRRLLGVEPSQQRPNPVKNALNEKAESQPKRRQDIDVIMMAANPDQARQLKPLFDFYYADDVPVYATSSIYDGTPNPRKDRDLNGVIFCDMPWLLEASRSNQMKRLLQQNGASSEQYSRLFAMGVDAYQLSWHGSHLGGSFPGVTGNLSIAPNYQVHRQLSWAKMVDGSPVTIH